MLWGIRGNDNFPLLKALTPSKCSYSHPLLMAVSHRSTGTSFNELFFCRPLLSPMRAQFWLSGSQQDSEKVQHMLKQLIATGVPKGGAGPAGRPRAFYFFDRGTCHTIHSACIHTHTTENLISKVTYKYIYKQTYQ